MVKKPLFFPQNGTGLIWVVNFVLAFLFFTRFLVVLLLPLFDDPVTLHELPV